MLGSATLAISLKHLQRRCYSFGVSNTVTIRNDARRKTSINDGGYSMKQLSSMSMNSNSIYHPYVTVSPDPHIRIFNTRSSCVRMFSQSIQESSVVQSAEVLLENIHDISGLPWWLSITLTTVCLRILVTFPASWFSNNNLAKLELLQPEGKKLAERLHLEIRHAKQRFKWSDEHCRLKYRTTIKKLVSDLYIRDNCHPFKSSLVLFVQLPIWFTISFALRNMSASLMTANSDALAVYQSLKTEGVLWFTDLTVADPTYVLPIAFVCINLFNIQLTASSRQSATKYTTRITRFLIAVTFLMFPIAATMPSCMSLYWVISSLCGLLQNTAFVMPKFRRFIGIPKVPSEKDTPFKDLLNSLRLK